MKTFKLSFILGFTCLSFLSEQGFSQQGQWVFKEIVHGNHFGSTRAPDKIDLDVNEGIIEFSLPQKNNCTDRYRLSYKFNQDMTVLKVPEASNSLPAYSYTFKFEPLTSPCYDPELQSYSNPYAGMTHWNAFSGLLDDLKKEKSWPYKYHQEFINNGDTEYHYAYRTSTYNIAGGGAGTYEITGPVQKDVAYTLESRPGTVTDFRILIKGQSTLPGREDDFYYDILFVYELVDGPVVSGDQPCDINPPDCSCCPGTIPVWNFNTNSGDCICPEGLRWDKLTNSCK